MDDKTTLFSLDMDAASTRSYGIFIPRNNNYGTSKLYSIYYLDYTTTCSLNFSESFAGLSRETTLTS